MKNCRFLLDLYGMELHLIIPKWRCGIINLFWDILSNVVGFSECHQHLHANSSEPTLLLFRKRWNRKRRNPVRAKKSLQRRRIGKFVSFTLSSRGYFTIQTFVGLWCGRWQKIRYWRWTTLWSPFCQGVCRLVQWIAGKSRCELPQTYFWLVLIFFFFSFFKFSAWY